MFQNKKVKKGDKKDPRKDNTYFQLPVCEVESFHHNPLILPFDV